MNLLTIVLGFLPGLAWLFFFLQEDSAHPEPKRLIIYTFLITGLITIPALAAEFLFEDSITNLNWQNKVLVIFFGLAAIEEFFKFAAVYLFIRRNREFNEPLDAMIYMITGALGFATIENIAVLGNVFNNAPLGFFLETSIKTLSLRFIGATLLHALASAIVGYYWAVGFLVKKEKIHIWGGLIIAILVHTGFNLLIMRFENVSLFYPSLFLMIIAFFIFADFEKIKKQEENTSQN